MIIQVGPTSYDHNISDIILDLDWIGYDSNFTNVKNLIENFKDESTEIQPTHLRLHPQYVQFYLTYCNIFIHGILPMSSLIILNIKINFG